MTVQSSSKAYAEFFESISQETSIESYNKIFNENVYFEDPFQKVNGIENIYAIFQHMYATLYNPHFKVTEIVCEKNCAYLRWDFSYRRSRKYSEEKFTGVSRVFFLDTGKVISHVDYWDAAENIYEKVPLLGSILRLIKRRISL